MRHLLLKLEPVIWLLFGQGILIGTMLLTAYLAIVGLAIPLGIVVRGRARLRARAAPRRQPDRPRRAVRADRAADVEGRASRAPLSLDLGGLARDAVVAPLLYGLALRRQRCSRWSRWCGCRRRPTWRRHRRSGSAALGRDPASRRVGRSRGERRARRVAAAPARVAPAPRAGRAPGGPSARCGDPALCAPGIPQPPERELLQPAHARLFDRLRPRDARADAPGPPADGGRARGLPKRARRRLRRRRVDGGARGGGDPRGLGLDPSPYLLRCADARVPRARFVQGLAEQTGFADARFDGIACCFVFHELPPRAADGRSPSSRGSRARALGSRSSSRPRSSTRPARGA